MTDLVIGAEGFLGGALARHLAATGPAPLTTRQEPPSGASPGLVLDLGRDDVAAWPVPAGVGRAFVCAAVSSIDRCARDPETTRRINVTHTLALSRRLSAARVRIVYPSTSQVFDGLDPRPAPTGPVNPPTEYGRQKAEVERGILALPEAPHAVVRLAKVFGPASVLVADWTRRLRLGEEIRPFTDLVLAPISLTHAVRVLVAVAGHPTGGIWQFSGREDLSYAEFAARLARHLGCPARLVRPVASADAGVDLGHLPRHATLDSTRVAQELGIPGPGPDEVIADLLGEGE
ncbi:MAG: sugar nucleotide-binding protein [Candidatus Riflebacteria bacterium]|nr:sugar nucleotide-binding protein [Candidatus Riflebacteria bacterium]